MRKPPFFAVGYTESIELYHAIGRAWSFHVFVNCLSVEIQIGFVAAQNVFFCF